DVLLADATANAGAGHLREVDTLLAGQTAHERGDIRGVLAHGLSSGCRSGRCFDSLSGLSRRSRLSGHRLGRLRCGLLLGRFLLRRLLLGSLLLGSLLGGSLLLRCLLLGSLF